MSERTTRALAICSLLLLVAGCHLDLFKPQEPFNYIDEDRTPQGPNATRAFPVHIYRLVLAEGGGANDQATAAERVVTVLSPTQDLGEVSLADVDHLGELLERVGVLAKPELWAQAAIFRQGTAVQERYLVICNVRELLLYGDLRQDLELRSGDVVFLPFESTPLLEALFTRFGVIVTIIDDIDAITRYLDLVEGF